MDWMVHKVRSRCSIYTSLVWQLTRAKGRDNNLSSYKVFETAYQHTGLEDSHLQSQSLFIRSKLHT
jgi:hypothetical protein